MLTRPLGAIRDELGTERGAPIRSLIGSARDGLPDAWDLRGPWTRYPMQIGQSCTGHALAQAVRTISKGELDPSAMAVYAIGRQIGSPYVSRLADGGAYTSRALNPTRSSLPAAAAMTDRSVWRTPFGSAVVPDE